MKQENVIPLNYLGVIWLFALYLFLMIIACGAPQVTPPNTNHTLQEMKDAFAPFASKVTITSDDQYLHISSDGLPEHNMMVGISNWQQQVPLPQSYTGENAWSIPLIPVAATDKLSIKDNFLKGAIAIAVNGIPVFNPLNNRGEDANLIGELDKWGGHCGRADDYHYHIPPLHLEEKVGNKPIAYALDGYPVYASKEPDGQPMQELDEYHGHVYNGQFHYHGTTTYPYMIAIMRGKVSLNPSTKAPENEIAPQARTEPIRPATEPLKGAEIHAFSSPSANAYSLSYKVAEKTYKIDYSWTDAGAFTFVFTDASGQSKTETYQKK